MLGQVYVALWRLLRFLLERVDHENRLGKFGYVKNPMLKLAMNAQFHDANQQWAPVSNRWVPSLYEQDGSHDLQSAWLLLERL